MSSRKRTSVGLSQSDEEDDVKPTSEELSQAKRSKIPSVPSSQQDGPTSFTYRAGSIRKITLHNFMTHKDISFRPGPRLNVVLGPNGTGKSSIVNAIAIGLAGSHGRILERAEDLSGYVRRGAKEAWVEIELQGKDSHRGRANKNVVIRRTINVEDNSSEWRLNGHRAKKEEVTTVIADLNIQLDNLTQFLPQEKVALFAAMSSEELLKKTQEAVLEPEIAKIHQDLINMRKEQKNVLQKYTLSNDALQKEIAKNQGIEREVQRMQQRQELVDKIEVMELKRPYLEFTAKKEAGKELADAKRELTKEINEKRSSNPFEEERKKLEARKRQTAEAIKEGEAAMKGRMKVLEKKTVDVDTVDVEIKKTQKELSSLEKRYSDAEKNKNAKMTAFTKAQEEYEHLKEQMPADLQEQTKRIADESRQLTTKMNEKMEADLSLKDDVAAADKKFKDAVKKQQDINNARVQRLNNLRQVDHKALRAWELVEKNRHRLSGKPLFFVPIDVQVPRAEHANFLEVQMPNYVMTSIICTDEGDKDALVREFRALKMQATVVYREYAREYTPPRLCELEPLKPLGLEHWLDNVIEAEPTIKAFLCETSHINKVAISTLDPRRVNIQELVNSTPLTAIFTTASRYLIKTSRYGAHAKSTLVIDVRPARLWKGADITQADQAIREVGLAKMDFEEIMKRKRELEAEIAEDRQQQEQLNRNRKELMEMSKSELALKGRVDRTRVAADEAAKAFEELNLDDEKKDIVRRVQQQQVKAGTILGEMAVELEELVSVSVEHDAQALRLKEVDAALQEVAQNERQHKQDLEKQEKQLAEIARKIESLKNELNAIRTEFERGRKDWIDKRQSDVDAFNAAMAELPEEIPALIEMMATDKARLEGMTENARVMIEYEDRKAKIAAMEQTVAELKATLDKHTQTQLDAKNRWLPTLQDRVHQIDTNFRQNCVNIGIAGEVHLKEVEEDYDKFAIDILVRFRKGEPLMHLNAHRQSGGERSVSTILYLLALQKLNFCPLRVIDEINQGMDPINERKVFEQLVSSSKAKVGEEDMVPQCFLITPKLLHDLIPNNRDVTVLFVFNGPLNVAQNIWDTVSSAKSKSIAHHSHGAASSSSAAAQDDGIEEDEE